jgi:hypothetical protein
MAGARIVDCLDLEALVLVRPLILDACFFDEAVRLDEARALRVELKGCWVPALSARQLETRGDLTLDRLLGSRKVVLRGARIGGVLALRDARLANAHDVVLDGDLLDVHLEVDCTGLHAAGEVSLTGAHIGGRLSFEGSRLSSETGRALNADRLQVDQSMFCRWFSWQRFMANGEVRLAGAHIGGQLSFAGARLVSKTDRALTADALQVDRSMSFGWVHRQRFEANSEVRLVGAHIGGQLSFEGARLSNETGPALNAERLQVDQSMFCQAVQWQSFEANGEVRLAGAHIGRQLSFLGARLSNENGLALNLENLDASDLWMPDEHAPDGMVDFTDAVVSQFHDYWRPPQAGDASHRYPLRVTGFVYHSLGSGSDACTARLDWLRHAEEGYVPQAYDHLTQLFRRAGRETDARKVAIAKERRRRSQRDVPLPAKAASYLLDVTAGYGYRTWRAAYALLAIVLIGWGVFAWAFPEHLTATRPAGQLPPFHPLLYSIDAVLPVINLGQESARTPTGAAQVWYAFSVLVGWLLSLGFVAYITAKLFRE